jgi:UDPglucose 6-dehydrogenase
MKRIAVIGTGYVGLVTGTCFAELGNHVTCIDIDLAKIETLREGEIPFFEPGLRELVQRNAQAGRLDFSASIAEGISRATVIFIAVGTPTGDDGHVDLSAVRAASIAIAENLDSDKIIVNKSTVPVETGDLVHALIRQHNRSKCHVKVVSNPEFLREGSAIADFMSPDRIVIGVDDKTVEDEMRDLYAPLNAPVLVTDLPTAEMIKYTANAFLAMRISFINEIAKICERVDASVRDIITGAGADQRIGTTFMNPGLGFGGSCFPKDVLALLRAAEHLGVRPRLLASTLDVNTEQISWAANRLEAHVGPLAGKRIGMWGLAFKANTDDVRESPAVAFARELKRRRASVIAHDPEAIERARATLGDSIEYAMEARGVATNADALVVATDWNEYKQVDFSELKTAMRNALLFDARNMYDESMLRAAGWRYVGIGKSTREPVSAAGNGTPN